MLHLNDVTLRVAGRPLLEGASIHIAPGQRVGLVGRNGTGKSTLLKLIDEGGQPDAGEIRLQRVARVAMVAQEAPGGAMTPRDAVLAADRERASLLAEAATTKDPARIAHVQTRLAEIGADAAPARAARILKGLGFDEAAQNRPLSSYSGGWRMRVALAATLFIEPDLLLLDEPTNHLDLEAVTWLSEHLRRYPRTLILVSHDRDLLNAVPERIVHLDGGKLTGYAGNYDRFARTRAERLVLLEKRRQSELAERAHIQSFIDRFRYKASKARQAQSRIKMLERMGPLAEVPIEPEVRFSFPEPKVPPPPLVTLDRADAGYDGRIVLRGLDLRIDPDDRIALLGANGNGKSTFAKLVAGRIEASGGEVTRARGLGVGFFAQHQIEDLDPDADGIVHLQRRLPSARAEALRARLARFGLGGPKAETKAKNLSGGEKTRLALCLMCLGDPQILILDEPTNHLDIDSRDALMEAINDYAGAVILISHDRRLVELTADRLWLVRDGGVRPFDGDLDDYRAQILSAAKEREAEAKAEARTERVPSLSAAERRQRLAPLRKRARDAEADLARLQARKAKLAARLADPATYANGADIAAMNREVDALGTRIEAAETRWLEAEAEIEAVDG
ncbi:MAG: ABC-F family ATP-binding cassette domain-containing protein [Geminicoccaceae bacterium]|nr:ABC-F family ATP-binding cassette domain-containing protein [Geminicoccaceae bacterium]